MCDLASLFERAHMCRLCPSMEGRRRVLGPGNGPAIARVLLVGEAPGRLGAERTGVPFQGDQSGRRLDQLLEAAGWTRADVFITNTVLCNPQDTRGRNRPPTGVELSNCRSHLVATLEALDSPVVVALGRRALAALADIHAHHLNTDVSPGALLPWHDGRWLGWVVHPSPLAAARRPHAVQVQDWQSLRAATDLVLQLSASSDQASGERGALHPGSPDS